MTLSKRPTRRAVLGGLVGSAATMLARPPCAHAADPLILEARPGTTRLLGADHPETAIWGYGGVSPGPVIRVRQGGEVQARLVNRIDEPTTIHWHGIRIDNRMDGVAHLTQDEVTPGATFDYRFTAPDAGTFWYHPHAHRPMQQDRGLYGLLIVEEPQPVAVDREIALVLDDWRLERDGTIETRSLASLHDAAHAGRLGNLLTVNGASQPAYAVRGNERIRLRLCSTCNARILQLRFEGVAAHLVATDGQPVDPEPLADGLLTLAPSQRADVVVDVTAAAGETAAIIETTRSRIVLARLPVESGAPARAQRLASHVRLPANPVTLPAVDRDPLRIPLVMAGGAMGMTMGSGAGSGVMAGRMIDGGTFRGERLGTRDLIRQGMAWTFNGTAGDPDGHRDPALFSVARGRTVVIEMANDTAWPHAMHVHGHHFRALGRRGASARGWLHDTVLMQPRERMTIAFAADNPGKWMLHCHMLEHQMSGMSSWFEVT
jgi:FtsP/CotA-like multicopper oxidase with cupredoxin domain